MMMMIVHDVRSSAIVRGNVEAAQEAGKREQITDVLPLWGDSHGGVDDSSVPEARGVH